MNKDTLPLQLRTRYVTGLTSNIQQYFEQETGVSYPAEIIDDALNTWLESRFDNMIESLGEVITSPHMAESQQFRRILEERMQSEPQAHTAAAAVEAAEGASVFTGARAFSPEKLGAMIEYISQKGRDIYKTNLNKLLFYSDLTFYYLHGRGISGATYVNLPYGPVPEHVENVIDDLAAAERINRLPAPERGVNAQMIKAANTEASSVDLDKDEMELLDWVLDTYGDMSPTQISDVSHAEKAYRFTRPQEPIAYEYAKFFERLPEKKQER
jgi:uncharacterized phage-associated protein